MWLKCLPPSSPLRSSSYFYMCSSTKNFIQMYIQLSNKLTCGIGGLWSKGSFNFTTLLITFCHKYMYICVYRLIFIILLSSVFLTLYFVQGSCYLLHIIIVFFFQMCLADAHLSFPVHSLTIKRSGQDSSEECKEVNVHVCVVILGMYCTTALVGCFEK